MRGLPSLEEARLERRRALVAGKVRFRGMAPRFWGFVVVVFAIFGVVYWKLTSDELESYKARVMAKQRATAVELGPRLLPLQEKIERWVVERAGVWPGDRTMTAPVLEDVQRASGLYLRLRLADAGSPERIRAAAARSLHDGFTSCFFVREGTPDPAAGPRCRRSADCEPGQLCNEYEVCGPPPRPYNLRLAYRALRVLSSAWSDELHRASNDITVRVFERDLDRVTREDVPVAAEILVRARYLTLVIDEDGASGLPDALPDAGETDVERLWRTEHPARVVVWRLADGEEVARLRATAGGQLAHVGQRRPAPEIEAAQQRQANACALAVALKEQTTAGAAGAH
ncbi:MAG: hypothetical protein IT376_14855 [Polyangiaceae bacterium]|nr:hypothetical protein [Polyangiaceae bacterium]